MYVFKTSMETSSFIEKNILQLLTQLLIGRCNNIISKKILLKKYLRNLIFTLRGNYPSYMLTKAHVV